MMKTTKPLSGIAAILLCTALTVCICACGDGKKDNRNVSHSDTVSASAVLTDEEWVEKLLREEFETIYEKPYDEVVFTHIKIYTREEIKEIEEVAERTFDEKEIVFDVTFDIKPTDPKDVERFMIPMAHRTASGAARITCAAIWCRTAITATSWQATARHFNRNHYEMEA